VHLFLDLCQQDVYSGIHSTLVHAWQEGFHPCLQACMPSFAHSGCPLSQGVVCPKGQYPCICNVSVHVADTFGLCDDIGKQKRICLHHAFFIGHHIAAWNYWLDDLADVQLHVCAHKHVSTSWLAPCSK
jgi:hypothetical protein